MLEGVHCALWEDRGDLFALKKRAVEHFQRGIHGCREKCATPPTSPPANLPARVSELNLKWTGAKSRLDEGILVSSSDRLLRSFPLCGQLANKHTLIVPVLFRGPPAAP